jgi:hypothetical protein
MPDDINSILGVSSDAPVQNPGGRTLPRYYLWIDGKQDGPFEPAAIRKMLESGQITEATLAFPESGGSDWLSIKDCPQILRPPKPSGVVLAAPAAASKFALPRIIAVLEFICSPLAGLGVGANDTEAGWLLFLSGVISGLFLFGFSQVIQNTYDSSQRLERIEMLIEQSYENKDATKQG